MCAFTSLRRLRRRRRRRRRLGCGYFAAGATLQAPFLIQYFVKFAAMPPALMKDEVGWHYTATIVVAMVVGNVLNAHSQAMMVRIAIQVRSMMVTSVFRKVLRLSSTAGAEFDQGHVRVRRNNSFGIAFVSWMRSC